MIKVEWCPEEPCTGVMCPRYNEQRTRWPRTIAVTMRFPVDARGIHALARRQAMQDIYMNGVTDGNGGPLHLSPSVAAYEIHSLGVQYIDADGVPYVALYAGVIDPIELAMREPVLMDSLDADSNWVARRRELGDLLLSEVLR